VASSAFLTTKTTVDFKTMFSATRYCRYRQTTFPLTH